MKKTAYFLLFFGCSLLFARPAFAVISAPSKSGAQAAGPAKAYRQEMKKQFQQEKKLARLERFLHRFYAIDMSDHTQKWLYLSIFAFGIAILLQLLYKAILFSFIISLANTFAVVGLIFLAVWLIKKYA